MPQKHKNTKVHERIVHHWITFVIFCVFVFLWQTSSAHQVKKDSIQYRFTQTDSSYSFLGHFKIDADAECILSLAFNPEHLIALAPDAEEVVLMDQGDDWNQLKYTYRKYWIFENTTAWHRKLDEENLRVDFTLLWSRNNLAIMPRVISSSGYYQIIPEHDSITVEYYQYCKISIESITNYYIERMKREAISFLTLLSLYAAEHCRKLAPTDN